MQKKKKATNPPSAADSAKAAADRAAIMARYATTSLPKKKVESEPAPENDITPSAAAAAAPAPIASSPTSASSNAPATAHPASSSKAASAESRLATKAVAAALNLNASSAFTVRSESTSFVGNERVTLSVQSEVLALKLVQEYAGLIDQTTDALTAPVPTMKKVAETYVTLERIGFSRQQIEEALTAIQKGTLEDALDWFCIHTPHESLPRGFSDKVDLKVLTASSLQFVPKRDRPLAPDNTRLSPVPSASVPSVSKMEKKPVVKANKDWILSYAGQSSDESEDDGENSQAATPSSDAGKDYKRLLAQFIATQNLINTAKASSDRKGQVKFEKQATEIRVSMNQLKSLYGLDTATLDREFYRARTARAEREAAPRASKPESDPSFLTLKSAERKGEAKPVDEEGDSIGLTDMFVNAEVTIPAITEEESIPEGLSVLPRMDWKVGQLLPQKLLRELVSREYLGAEISYRRAAEGPAKYHKWQIVIKAIAPEPFIPPEFSLTQKEALEVAAAWTLFRLFPNRPSYLRMPYDFHSLWLRWVKDMEAKSQAVLMEENAHRIAFAQQFVEQLKKAKVLSMPATLSPNRVTQLSFEVKENLPLKRDTALDATLQKMLIEQRSSGTGLSLIKDRAQLPAARTKDVFIQALEKHQVVIVAGETGSGKSTQMPQYILEAAIEAGSGSLCNVVCTQPRRISALSISYRVSQELGDSKIGQLCGYQIRDDSQRSSKTRLLYCTTGVLLRRFQSDPLLRGVSHVVLDEVHERSIQSDFLMALMQRVLPKRPDLKLILMSATMNAERLATYFKDTSIVQVEGRTFPVTVLFAEDIFEATQFSIEPGSQFALYGSDRAVETKVVVGRGDHQQHVTSLMDGMETSADSPEAHGLRNVSWLDSSKYSKRTRASIARWDESRINTELILETLVIASSASPYCDVEGSILVFLPGLGEIRTVHDLLCADRRFSDPSKYLLIPLHSSLSADAQQLAFKPMPKGLRKIILTTNIAETGITIPDAVCVIDTGKVKEILYNEHTRTQKLQEILTSRASADQRKGRAGRVRAGYCFRLFTSHTYHVDMRAQSIPEMLRTPLEGVCLSILAQQLGHPTELLSTALDPPDLNAVRGALNHLERVSAVTVETVVAEDAGSAADTERIELTPLGRHLAELPVDVHTGKILLYGLVLGCLDTALSIAAIQSAKSIFVSPFDNLEAANVAKRVFMKHHSDLLTEVNAYNQWRAIINTDPKAGREFVRKSFLSRETLENVKSGRSEFFNLLKSMKFLPHTCQLTRDLLDVNLHQNRFAENPQVLNAVLAAGLYPSFAYSPDRRILKTAGEDELLPHPSSVLRYAADWPSKWVVFHSKEQARRHTFARQCNAIPSLCLLLFGGKIDVHHGEQTLSVDSWVQFKAAPKTAVLLKNLRGIVSVTFQKMIEDPSAEMSDAALNGIIQILSSQ